MGTTCCFEGSPVSQVLPDYGDVCQAVSELAAEMNAPISTDDFRTLNQRLDDAIAGAVTESGRARNQSTLDGETARGSERGGCLAHELRNLYNTAIVAFEVLKKGNVGVACGTGTVLHRSLLGLRALMGRSFAEVRLTQGIQNREQFQVSAFIEEVASDATLGCSPRGIRLAVMPVEDGVAIEIDRPVLAALTGNLLRRTHLSSPRLGPLSRCGSAPAACSLRSRTNAAVARGECRRAVPAVRAARRRSNRLGYWSRLQPMGAAKRTMVGFTRATCLI